MNDLSVNVADCITRNEGQQGKETGAVGLSLASRCDILASPSDVWKGNHPIMTPEEAAQVLYDIIPRGMSRELLEEYGIGATDEQAGRVTREVLSLNLYWVRAAIEAHIPRQYRNVLFERLLQLIRQDWEEGLRQKGKSWEEFLTELAERDERYRPFGNQPGGELAVATEAGALLEDHGAVQA
ncbi:MAG TPA: hypothetical protein VJ805_03445, partial [Nitrospiraceae bacterium]|nr:hypothetical protein [Nitrospiraceae bacterium]